MERARAARRQMKSGGGDRGRRVAVRPVSRAAGSAIRGAGKEPAASGRGPSTTIPSFRAARVSGCGGIGRGDPGAVVETAPESLVHHRSIGASVSPDIPDRREWVHPDQPVGRSLKVTSLEYTGAAVRRLNVGRRCGDPDVDAADTSWTEPGPGAVVKTARGVTGTVTDGRADRVRPPESAAPSG